jgi:hypothetical protein
MKRPALFYWLRRLFSGNKRAIQLKLLRELRQVLYYGLETSAEVIDADLQNDLVGGLVQVKLMLKMKKTDGSYSYTNTSTLVALRHIPDKGALLHIKYIPDNPDTVVIL